jgi:hypothetical protein
VSGPYSPDRDLGLAGLLATGWSPEEAREIIRADLAASGGLAIIAGMETTADGRAALEWSRQQWAKYHLAPPWEEEPPSDRH